MPQLLFTLLREASTIYVKCCCMDNNSSISCWSKTNYTCSLWIDFWGK